MNPYFTNIPELALLKPAKNEADVLNLTSYGITINGPIINQYSEKFSQDYRSKFQYIDEEGGQLNFSVACGNVNGKLICPSILGDLTSITVDQSNLQSLDDGQGAYYSNYTSYLKRVFEKLGLNSVLSSNGGYNFGMKYYRSESFDLIFKEVFTDTEADTYTTYWGWRTINGLGVADYFGESSLLHTQPPAIAGEAFTRWDGSLFLL